MYVFCLPTIRRYPGTSRVETHHGISNALAMHHGISKSRRDMATWPEVHPHLKPQEVPDNNYNYL